MTSNKKYVVSANFIKTAFELKLSLQEFLLLLYFENSDDYILDFDKAAKKLKIPMESILEAFNSLLSKNMIELSMEKDNNGKRFDKVSLENFHNNIGNVKKREEKGKIKEDIFTKFESEFRRPLRGMEFEIIKAWIEKPYNEELILAALSEAVYNGTLSIRYIDTILHEWNKKGFITKEDVDNYFSNKHKSKKKEEENSNLFEYNWLDDYER